MLRLMTLEYPTFLSLMTWNRQKMTPKRGFEARFSLFLGPLEFVRQPAIIALKSTFPAHPSTMLETGNSACCVASEHSRRALSKPV